MQSFGQISSSLIASLVVIESNRDFLNASVEQLPQVGIFKTASTIDTAGIAETIRLKS